MNELHSDLQADLAARGIAPGQVQLLSGLEVLQRNFFTARKELIDDISRKLADDAVEDFKIESWIDENLPTVLNERDISPAAFGLPHYEEVTLINTTSVEPLNVLSARYTTMERASLLLEVEVEGRFEVLIDFFKDMPSAPFAIDLESGLGYDHCIFYVILALTVNMTSKTVEAADVVKVARSYKGARR